MYKLAPSLPPELAAALASCRNTKQLATATAASPRRVVDARTRRALLAWARQKDLALTASVNKRCVRVAAQRPHTEDPRGIGELQELRSFRASCAFTAMPKCCWEPIARCASSGPALDGHRAH
jgi:hypothetical protein